MVVFPNGKINLGLHITGKRNDGFHNLETIFFPVPFCDALEIIAADHGTSADQFVITGQTIEGNPGDNLCLKAVHILRRENYQIPFLRIHLHKVIPMGAGLGGGSSDGAHVLMLLNDKYRLGLTREQLATYALELGSDCPFFIYNTPSYGTGRGEELTPVTLTLSGYYLELINPGIHVSTREAFAGVLPVTPVHQLTTVITEHPSSWKNTVFNDFEKGVFALHPAIAEIKASLYRAGAVYAAMSGSGSTVFGLFEEEPLYLHEFPASYCRFSTRL